MPYGEVFLEKRNKNWNTPYLFNGKEQDEESGLYYYGARYYDARKSLWLSVDPMTDTHPGLSPYLYCLGNPVRYIDPNGMDEYGVNTLGKVEWLRETNDEKDLLIAGAYRNRKGEVKGLRYDKDGNLRNHTIEVSKGVFTERSINHKVLKGHQYVFADGKEAENVFKFMADNTQVEWGFYNKKFNEGNETFYLSTSHKWNREEVSAKDIYFQADKAIVKFHIHSHPYDANAFAGVNAKESEKDKNFAKEIQIIFEMNKKSSPKFYILSRGIYSEYTP